MGKKKATEKDVRYAIEYAGERIIRTIRNDGSGKFDYTVSPSNLICSEQVFYSLSRRGILEAFDPGLFPGHPQSFRFKR